MSHGAAQIHAALVLALTGLSTTGGNVFADEVSAIPESRLPALRVLDDGGEEIDYATTSRPRTLLRRISFSVRVLAKASIARVELNSALSDIESALYANSLGGLVRDLRIESVTKQYSDDADQRVGSADIRVVADWVSLEGSPETCL